MRSLLIIVSLFCVPFFIKGQHQHILIIEEIFADPSPAVGLPAAEFISIRNISRNTIDIKGWKLGRDNEEVPFRESSLIPPDSFLIICRTSAQSEFLKFGNAYGLPSFPALPNEEGLIYLRSAEGYISHSIFYNSSWHSNSIKAAGGWSLEMIDTGYPCAGRQNWTSSIHQTGGTPGIKNSAEGQFQPHQNLSIRNTFMPDSLHIRVWFNEPVDSISATDINSWILGPGNQLQQVTVPPPQFNVALLRLEEPLPERKTIEIEVRDILNCRGEVMKPMANKILAGRNSNPIPGDIIINEIMFNPPTNGHDYVEVYNRSDKIIDAGVLYISNRSPSGNINEAVKISGYPRSLFPADFLVITEDSIELMNDYLMTSPACITEISSVPSFPDDRGSVVITDHQGNIIDEVNYKEEWHFPLINNKNGTPLERIDPEAPSNDPNNWTSAAGNLIYGTPGLINSQNRTSGNLQAAIMMDKDVFSPDNDGFEDYLIIRYHSPQPGTMATISIYTSTGQPVKHLVNNQLLSTEGMLRWDGLNDAYSPSASGLYILVCRLFTMDGKTSVSRHAFSLSRSSPR